MSDMVRRLHDNLEPVLSLPDPRAKISAYHDMPYAIFHYKPSEEFALRQQVALLSTRLEQKGKRVHRISLSDCLWEALGNCRPLSEWFDAERDHGVDTLVDTIHNILSAEEGSTLLELVVKRLPPDADPRVDIVFLQRVAALFPVYRTFPLLEQLKGQVVCPAVLFYPGLLDGAAGLKFMGVLPPEHNYRPKIF